MTPRWVTFDKMIRELGAVRMEIEAASGTPSETAPEARALRDALDHASDAVHHCLVEEDERTLQVAWEAIAEAQDAVRRARSVIAAGRRS